MHLNSIDIELVFVAMPKKFAIRSGLIEALRQTPVKLQDMDPGLKHRAIGNGVTSKAMALPLFPFTNIFCLKWSSNAAVSLSEVTLSINRQVKGLAQ